MSTIPSALLTTCYFLELPAELRNTVYEVVFPAAPEEEVDINKAEPPSNALILTCKQIHVEANKMYQHSYRQYWTETNFVTYRKLASPSEENLQWRKKIRLTDIRHITNMKIVMVGGIDWKVKPYWQLIDVRGI